MHLSARLISSIAFLATCGMAQSAAITSATRSSDNSVDVNVSITASSGAPITLNKINWYNDAGTLLGSTTINDTFSSNGIQVFTFSSSQVPAGATKCMIDTSNGGSNGNTQFKIS